ncbi:TPA: fimbrial protein [Providencia alcalifaciens]|uniref:Fimbrial protein n=2 Tax=Providencia alcalifaciens TaxID=126385 RepID=A0AAW9VAF4_9GAMM|nr:fimbrial protein [Providencia alcalifaciens]ATG15545.1 pilus assembly protein [Providencia alcalifaciens]EEB47483.1 fimbrial protein [Providencia alcalifaciens DSM 30120]EUD04883.1 fimbrial protein [Providencia alcalifaciens RIMD 1656011]MBF0693246.1 fimbrial protein [Providencia alcalifaciens]MTC25458.1 fimbrial protein [Providencia alcalifaciens]
MNINKKIAMLSVVISSIVCSAAFAENEPLPAQVVNGGNITFNGEVTSGPCAVSSADTDKIVTLDTVKSTVFTAADQLANASKPFNINLLECDTDVRKSVQVTFNGQTVEGKPGLLANTAGVGSAKNVALQLFNPDGSALDIGALSSKVNLAETTTIPLSVDYKSTAAAVTAGKVQSVANFTLTYN